MRASHLLHLYSSSFTFWRRQRQPTPVSLAWKIPWTEEPGVLQSMGSWRVRHDWGTYFSFTFHFHALEKEMATHSSVLAWRIPWMGDPAGLPSMGSHRVRHGWSDLAAAAVTFKQGFEAASWESVRIPSVSYPCFPLASPPAISLSLVRLRSDQGIYKYI